MGRTIELINVVDVESTCWERTPPKGQRSDIIEIGICTLTTRNLEIADRTSFFVKPQTSTVSEFCTRLTTITPEMVATGISFLEACDALRRNFHSTERIWASYGDYDRKQFERCCQRSTRSPDAAMAAYPFGSRHINVKTLIAAAKGWEYEIGMDEALNRLGLPLKGTHHRAGDDALNIAEILATIFRKNRS